MPAESIFEPITIAMARQVRARLALQGDTVQTWAKRAGYDPKLVYAVLSGKRKAQRGQSLQIAIKLGLRPDPTAPAPFDPASPQGLPDSSTPAGRTIAGGPPVASCDRRPIPQLGEAVR